ncbi:MAG: endonuclease III [Candidatus Bathyarchaeota archaeon]|nr:endonuclease III [Candidatus Bathyarchaeota archaeon]MDH5494418.1 endonuclease III [Candidatus Bathyarchaeota archaeon]
MTKKRANKILKVLRKEFKLPDWRRKERDPFETLIVTVISQNTNGRNTARAFENLSNKFEITPEALSKADVEEVEEALKVAGLYRNKSKVIKKLSRIVLEDFGGSLNFIFGTSLEQAREKLLGLPGVGSKTADVVLLFSAKKPTLPVDTHVNRVSKRLGLVDGGADYEGVRKRLQLLFDSQDYYAVHMLLILHGRRYCRAKKPLCKKCPVNQLCPFT